MYKHIFFDLDHTLWDFETNANITLKWLFEEFNFPEKGLHSLEEFKIIYHEINLQMWADYEQGRVDQHTLRYKRFYDSMLRLGIDDIEFSKLLGHHYLEHLPKRSTLMPGAMQVLEYLQPKYKIHLITNGFDKVQQQKLINSNIDHFFDVVVTSEFAGYKKPSREIFYFAISEVHAYPSNCIMIGDNYDNDVLGAANAGINQVYYNPEKKAYIGQTPTHEIAHLVELIGIL